MNSTQGQANDPRIERASKTLQENGSEIGQAHQFFLQMVPHAKDFVIVVHAAGDAVLCVPLRRNGAANFVRDKGFLKVAQELEKLDPMTEEDRECAIRVVLFEEGDLSCLLAPLFLKDPSTFSEAYHRHILPEASYGWLEETPEEALINCYGPAAQGKA